MLFSNDWINMQQKQSKPKVIQVLLFVAKCILFVSRLKRHYSAVTRYGIFAGVSTTSQHV